MPSVIQLAVAASVVLVLAIGVWLGLRTDPPAGPAMLGGVASAVKVGGPFELTDHHGNAVTNADFHGRYMLIFFGYTFCPDVCPTELGNLSVALDELGDDADQVAAAMITIDPTRDTPAVLADYVSLFHERFVGLTGTQRQIEQVAKDFRVFYRQVDDPNYSYYLMDHSSFTYLMNPDGEFVTMFRYGTDPAQIAETIRRLLRAS